MEEDIVIDILVSVVPPTTIVVLTIAVECEVEVLGVGVKAVAAALEVLTIATEVVLEAEVVSEASVEFAVQPKSPQQEGGVPCYFNHVSVVSEYG